MISRFFIERPIFANVIAIVTIILGVVAVLGLPIAQYPEITPPTVQVTASYPGASAQVVADTVALPIEQQVNGVENMLYMSSTSTNDGTYTLDRHLRGRHRPRHGPGAGAEPRRHRRAAAAARRAASRGPSPRSSSPAILLVVNLSLARRPLRQPVPEQLRLRSTCATSSRGCRASATSPSSARATTACGSGSTPRSSRPAASTRSDVVSAIQQQNVQVAAGQIGQPPAPAGQELPVHRSTWPGRLTEVEQFENIIVKIATGQGGRIIRAQGRRPRRAGRPDLQTSSAASTASRPRASPSSSCPAPTRCDVADEVGRAMERAQPQLPPGHRPTPSPSTRPSSSRASIHEVYKTLFEAGVAGADRHPGLPAGLARDARSRRRPCR